MPPEKIPGERGKDKLLQLQKMIERLFRRHLTKAELCQLVASCDTLPVRVELWGFTTDVLAFMVKVFVEQGDRASLLRLLSKRCPSRIDWPVTIEFYLAVEGKKLKDPVLILGEAYSQCQVPETQHALAAAVRRGFVDLGIRGADDAEYVKNAMQWYEKEKKTLIPSWKYPGNELASPFSVEDYERAPDLYENPRGFRRYPLFLQKPVAK